MTEQQAVQCVCVRVCGRYVDCEQQSASRPANSEQAFALDHFIVIAASLATCEVSALKPKHTRPPMQKTEISPHDKRGRWGISSTQICTGRLA